MKKYKGVIFDLDGTLLNTIDDISDSMNEVLKSYRHSPYTCEEYKLKVGGGFRGLVETSFPTGTDEDTLSKGIELFAQIYNDKYLSKTRPYDGIMNVLIKLKEHGMKMGVNSNKKQQYTLDLLHKYLDGVEFVGIYGEQNDIPKKPDPTAALEIVDAMGLKKEEILYVGDSEVDMMTAKNAGIDSVGVLWGFRSYDVLYQHDATYIVANPNDLLSILIQEEKINKL